MAEVRRNIALLCPMSHTTNTNVGLRSKLTNKSSFLTKHEKISEMNKARLMCPKFDGLLPGVLIVLSFWIETICVKQKGLRCCADTRWHGMRLRSTNRQLLAVPRYRLNTYGRRAFSVAGPTVWNSLSRISSGTRPSVRTVSDGCLKRTYSLDTSAFSALEVLFNDNCAI